MSSPFSKLGFRFLLHLHFNPRYFCNSANPNRIFISDPLKFRNFVKKNCRLGFDDLQFPINIFHKMMSVVPLPSIAEFSRLFTAMLKLKLLHPHYTIISLFSHLELSGIRPDLQSMSILANCYCYLGRVDFGYSLLAKCLKLGYPFESDLVLFNTLINGHVLKNQFQDAIKLLGVAVVKLGIQPNILTYGTLIKGLCGIGDNAGALHLFRQINSLPGCSKPGIVIYNTLINSLLKDGLVTEALNLFSDMKTDGIKPEVLTYNSLIHGMFNLGRKRDAMEMLVEMIESNIEPNVATYNMLIDLHGKDMMINEAQAILPMMIKRGLTLDIVTYGALMNGYCLCGQMDKAMDLMDLMVKTHCQPNVVTFSTLIKGFVNLQRMDEALDMFHKMCEHGIAPNEWVYNILIGGLYRASRVQDAENLVSDLLSRGLVPSRRTLYARQRPVNLYR